MVEEDQSLAYLLDLDGEEIVYESGHIARFKAKKINATPEKPHGISYSLTLHAKDGRRLIGYDNAHNVVHRGGRFVGRPSAFDHWHRSEADKGRPYCFTGAEKLIADFFDAIDRVLKEQGND
jgi:hypothetical protein